MSTQEQSKFKHQLDVLYRVDSFMSTLSDLKQLLEQIMLESQNITDAEASSLALYDAAANDFVFEIVLGEKGSETKQIRVKYGEGIIGQVAQTGKPKNIRDVYEDQAFAPRIDLKTGFKTRSMLAVPMFRRGKLIGVIEVLNKKNNGAFTDEDETILEILAHQAAVAIENARLYQDNLAKERLACLGQGISGAAHCIKNLLSVVTLSASSIDYAIENNNKEVLADSWDILKSGFERISAMVMDMLNYSKDRPPEYEPTQLNGLLASIFSLVGPKLAEKQIEPVQDFDSRIAEVILDPKGIHRCVMNLVSNAIDAMTKTGGRITIQTLLDEPTKMLQIQVSDNGSGIPQESLEKIFDVFFSTKGSNGTGLGLSVTRKIITEHGGTISVQSVVDEGTTFIIRLPARAA